MLVPAVLYDWRYYRIPNCLILSGYVLGMTASCRGGTAGFTEFVLGALLPVIVLILVHRMGILGGGDVKLLSVAGGFLGLEEGMKCVLYSFLFGAGISLLVLMQKRNFKTRICYFLNYIRTVIHTGIWTPYYQTARDGYDNTIHFSAAILLAALLVIWESM